MTSEKTRLAIHDQGEEIRIVALFGARVMHGQERANIETLACLREQGSAVLCVVRDEDWLQPIRDDLNRAGLDWVMLPYIDYPVKGWLLSTLRRNPLVFLRANRQLPTVARNFNATHIHVFNSWYVAAFWLALKKLDLPMVYRSGELPVLHNKLYRAIWRFIIWRASVFVADSRFIAGKLVESGVGAGSIAVAYAPAPRRFGDAAAHLPQAAMSAGHFRFLYAGRMSQSKGLGELLSAFRIIAQSHGSAHLLLAGEISEWAGDSWARALRDDTLNDELLKTRVHFLGFSEHIPQLMSACHVHVAPSLVQEGYGLVVVEAKQAGRPSIIFPSGGMCELVTDGVDGIVTSGHTSVELARAMGRYLDDPGLAEIHGGAARASIKRLHIDQFAEKWLAVYKTVARMDRQ